MTQVDDGGDATLIQILSGVYQLEELWEEGPINFFLIVPASGYVSYYWEKKSRMRERHTWQRHTPDD